MLIVAGRAIVETRSNPFMGYFRRFPELTLQISGQERIPGPRHWNARVWAVLN
ncbi:MAG: hypothetical protein HYX77_01385 [Acidobacteria bacterium]|nr:hypothetical protein [Acidobacteriota bacterium]